MMANVRLGALDGYDGVVVSVSCPANTHLAWLKKIAEEFEPSGEVVANAGPYMWGPTAEARWAFAEQSVAAVFYGRLVGRVAALAVGETDFAFAQLQGDSSGNLRTVFARTDG